MDTANFTKKSTKLFLKKPMNNNFKRWFRKSQHDDLEPELSKLIEVLFLLFSLKEKMYTSGVQYLLIQLSLFQSFVLIVYKKEKVIADMQNTEYHCFGYVCAHSSPQIGNYCP